MIIGTVTRFDESRGYGFIARKDGGKEVFVHRNAIIDTGLMILAVGQQVRFDVQEGHNGPGAATNVQLTEEKQRD